MRLKFSAVPVVCYFSDRTFQVTKTGGISSRMRRQLKGCHLFGRNLGEEDHFTVKIGILVIWNLEGEMVSSQTTNLMFI